MIRGLILCWVLLGYVRSQSINADGTPIDFGGDGSMWTNSDNNDRKFYAGLNCHTSEASADDITIDFAVYQAHFEVDNSYYYNWTHCESVDAAMAEDATTPMAVEVTGCTADVSGDKAQYFSFSQNLSAMAGATTVPCGGTLTGTVWKFAMRCSRWAGYDAEYDEVFIYTCDQADNNNTLIRTLEGPMVQVGDIAVEKITRRYQVLMEVIESSTVPTPYTAAITGAVDLGAPLWIRWTLKIYDPYDNRTMFDMDGKGPVGVFPYSCTAQQLRPDHADCPTGSTCTEDDPDVIGAAVDLIDDKGCGLYSPIAQQFKDKRAKYIKDVADGPEAMMFSPNSFVQGGFEAVSFLGKNIQLATGTPTRKLLVKCSAKYCFKTTAAASGDLICFGDGTGLMTSAGYNSCPGAPEVARRRRSAEPDPDLDLPDTVSTVIEIKVRDEKKEEKSKGFPKCIANTTFYALTGVLAFLLLVVLTIGGYLTLKLRRVLNDRDSENSMTGIPNKAYY